MNLSENSITNKIRKEFTNRVLLTIGFLFLMFFLVTGYQIYLGNSNLKSNLYKKSQDLETFIVSQSLYHDNLGINIKLSEFNQENKNTKVVWIPNQNLKSEPKLNWKYPLNWVYTYPLRSIENNDFGHIQIFGSYFNEPFFFHDIFREWFFFLLFSLIFFSFLYPLAKRIPRKLFLDPILHILNLIKDAKNIDKLNLKALNFPDEIYQIEEKIIDLVQRIEEDSRNSEFAKLTSQVIHDIRSPIAELKSLKDYMKKIPEDQRVIFNNALNLLSKITESLLEEYRVRFKESLEVKNNDILDLPEPLYVILENIVDGKRTQYCKNGHPEINLYSDSFAIFSFVKINTIEFKRVISNLISNAFEALPNESLSNKINGKIDVRLERVNDVINIHIIDNGCGIPQELFNKIIEGGLSYGKRNGSGLGISYAIACIKKWCGTYNVNSQEGYGTTFTISLPCAEQPLLFLGKLNLKPTVQIIVLDDDDSIHTKWDKKLDILKKENNFTIRHFHQPEDLIEFINESGLNNNLFLLDYHLCNNDKNGLDVISSLKIEEHSILVTNSYDDEFVRERCLKMGIRILPKSHVDFIPIEVNTTTKTTEIIFIDDNEAITRMWKLKAQAKGIKLADFMKKLDAYEKNSIFYIDAELDNQQSGVNLAKLLYEHKFSEIYLSTGLPKEALGNIPWVKNILCKEPPF
jgi:signal transduction histidine kinase